MPDGETGTFGWLAERERVPTVDEYLVRRFSEDDRFAFRPERHGGSSEVFESVAEVLKALWWNSG